MENNQEGPNPQLKNIFLNRRVRKSKNRALKTRLQTLIKSQGRAESEFYRSLGYSKQSWYAISWGIWEARIEDKVKIAKALQCDSSVIFVDKERGEGDENKT